MHRRQHWRSRMQSIPSQTKTFDPPIPRQPAVALFSNFVFVSTQLRSVHCTCTAVVVQATYIRGYTSGFATLSLFLSLSLSLFLSSLPSPSLSLVAGGAERGAGFPFVHLFRIDFILRSAMLSKVAHTPRTATARAANGCCC